MPLAIVRLWSVVVRRWSRLNAEYDNGVQLVHFEVVDHWVDAADTLFIEIWFRIAPLAYAPS